MKPHWPLVCNTVDNKIGGIKVKNFIYVTMTFFAIAVTPQLLAADVSVLLNQIRQLEANVSASASDYTQRDVVEIQEMVRSANGLALSPSGGNQTSACVDAADGTLGVTLAQRLCASGGTLKTWECADAANGTLGDSLAVDLCRNRGTLDAWVCADAANGTLGDSLAVDLCRNRGTLDAWVCADAANGTLGDAEAVRLCKNGGTLANWQCADDLNGSIGDTRAVDSCMMQDIP